MNDSLGKHYLDDAVTTFRDYKRLAEKAFEQISDEEFFLTLDEEANSIGVIIKHMSGNMLSRWTDFLTSDGEKPDRNRDMEFVLTPETTRDDLLEQWEKGWSRVFDAVESLQPEDLGKKVLIRGEEHSVVEAITRQLTHYAYHWKSLSIPRNRSAEFNAYLTERNKEADERARARRFSSSLDFIRDSEAGNKSE
jgi:hypothetical protein